jgi:hypothetical protein
MPRWEAVAFCSENDTKPVNTEVIVTKLRAGRFRNRSLISGRVKRLFFSETSTPGLGPTQRSLLQWLFEALSLAVKWPGAERLSNVEINIKLAYSSSYQTCPYSFVSLCFGKQKDKYSYTMWPKYIDLNAKSGATWLRLIRVSLFFCYKDHQHRWGLLCVDCDICLLLSETSRSVVSSFVWVSIVFTIGWILVES